jgi:hypothetical protein
MKATRQLRTVWRLVGLPGLGGLDIELVVDTISAPVVEAIECAAERAGIELARVDEDES